MEGFNIPIVLIMFKRSDTIIKIIDRIRQVAPKKLYLMSDAGRNDEEQKLVENCRRIVEDLIDWECELIKNYAEHNRGVHANIGLGAKWVFEREEQAIFLEDDNLPEVTFFPYCAEMLQRYKDDTRILWVCGTNYLAQYESEDGASYMFTRHLLPCGWASWADKFIRFYDSELELSNNHYVMKNCASSYCDLRLYKQQMDSIMREQRRKTKDNRFASWDFHMALTLRANELLGISPAMNQIKNIGVDDFSTHGGSSFQNKMTQRFCGMESYGLEFPLKHPATVQVNMDYERRITKVILLPLRSRFKAQLISIAKLLLKIHKDDSLSMTLRNRLWKKKL